MKWFKHISDSLDDPFIFDLCQECGPSGYYVFFGVLEIYAREFKVQNGFKLVLSLHYLCTKLAASRKQLIIKALKFCSESGKFDVIFNGEKVEIFIPKFRKYLDETTLKKLRLSEKKSGTIPESIRNQSGINPLNVATEVEVDVDNTPYSPPKNGGPPYTKIISYLNEKTGRYFNPSTKETQRLIRARWNAGFKLDQFFHVIDVKAAKWLTDPKMVDYLRPATLFGTKFESYLNESMPSPECSGGLSQPLFDPDDPNRFGDE